MTDESFVIHMIIVCLKPVKLFHLGVKNLIYLLTNEKGFSSTLYYKKLILHFFYISQTLVGFDERKYIKIKTKIFKIFKLFFPQMTVA